MTAPRPVLALIALVGCTHTLVTAPPSTLVRHETEFAARDHASVEVDQGGKFDVDGEHVITVTVPGNERSHLWGLIKTGTPDLTTTGTIHNFVAACAADRSCSLGKSVEPVALGDRRRLSPGLLAMALFGAVATVVSSICLAECRARSGGELMGPVFGVGTMIYPMTTTF